MQEKCIRCRQDGHDTDAWEEAEAFDALGLFFCVGGSAFHCLLLIPVPYPAGRIHITKFYGSEPLRPRITGSGDHCDR